MTDGGGPAGYLPPPEAALLRRVLAAAGIVDRTVRAQFTRVAELIHGSGHTTGYDRGYLDGYADRAAGAPPAVTEPGGPDRGGGRRGDVVDAEPEPPTPRRDVVMYRTAVVPPWDDPELARLDPARRSDFPGDAP